jgi:uncharacterized Rmd1/YagE family protein
MVDELFSGADNIKAHVAFIGQRLKLGFFENRETLASTPLTVKAGSNGIAVLFRYGVVVFFGLAPAEMIDFYEDLSPNIVEKFGEPQWDEVDLFCLPEGPENLDNGRINLQAFNLQRLQIVAGVLAKSVVLSHYEINLTKHFDLIEPLALNLKQGGLGGSKGKALLQFIGDVLLIEGKMIGRVEISEKPELIWDYPEYERLFLRLEDEYELAERHSAVDRKLALITRTAETLLSLLQNKRSLRVEWYIVILIVIEIIIMLGEKIA